MAASGFAIRAPSFDSSRSAGWLVDADLLRVGHYRQALLHPQPVPGRLVPPGAGLSLVLDRTGLSLSAGPVRGRLRSPVAAASVAGGRAPWR